MFPMVFAPSSKLIQYVSTVVAVATPTPNPPTCVALPGIPEHCRAPSLVPDGEGYRLSRQSRLPSVH